ncbi:MAG: CRTAC1 family protein [Lewinellaceae bacterium]|nr:CRTAC1 family protein [Saprospiraceae bacterium]MCB9337297.1 CRTAC1 family protein [Lewinellaceae bacterium]
MKRLFPLFTVFLFLVKTQAQTLNVPADFATIQAAINASQNGDTVLVQPGEYVENLRFNGKSIVLTSRFFLTGHAADIETTIINGSQPAHPDTASCILIVDGESAATVVQGFTITGGKGTRWLDPAGAGTFREGGGILAEGTSPTIQFNIIRDNEVGLVAAGMVSNGGGGIRCGDGSPVIRNNWIHHNKGGGYGGAVVFNYCTGQVSNNLVSFNEGGKDYGGGGLWFTGTNQNTVVQVFNNTIVNNVCTGTGQWGGKGGGIFVFSIKLDAWNNIIWSNAQTSGGPVAMYAGGAVAMRYSDVQGGFAGEGNFSNNPMFRDTLAFSLRYSSPCVDAGDPAVQDFTVNSLNAAFPSLCRLHSDVGAFGGQGASALPFGLEPITRLFEKITDGPHVTTPSDSRSVNFVDVDNDGDEDLFITNGPAGGAKNLLCLNDGEGRFTAVTAGDIVSDAAPFDGATFADFDNDGDLDAFAVTWYGKPNYLYAGNGDGTFTKIQTAAPAVPGTYSETASWGDSDQDGDLDLYQTNSTDLNGTPLPNLFYRNDGNGSFTKIQTGPVATDAKASRSVNWVDYDNDCDADLFVSNEDNQPDDLYQNNGDGTFTKVTSGAPSQASRSTMSSSWGDVDNDGDLDLFVSNAAYFAQQNNQLFLNNGNGTFTEITTGDLVTDGGCSYGSNFGDYDNDGDLDLVVSNGFCNGNIVNFLYQNDGHGTFTRDLESAENLSTPCSYGTAWGDVNNDGFLDLGIATCKNNAASPLPNNLFYLNNGNCNNWLKVKLNGTGANHSAIGAKIWVTTAVNGQSTTQLREISAQSGYCGQNSLTAHFGLGEAEMVEEVKIQFSCNSDTVLLDVPANQLLEITEALPTATRERPDQAPLAMTLFPNPSWDTFRVDIEMKTVAEDLEMSLTNSQGQVVWTKAIKLNGQAHHSEQLSAASLGMGSGYYFLEAKLAGSAIRQKFAILK